MLQNEYACAALKNELLLDNRLTTNPYKFGMVSRADSHTSLAAVEEEIYFGIATNAEPKPDRTSYPFGETDLGVFDGYKLASAGYTRESVWDSMTRKETYATTGPRMMTRFFGVCNYTGQDRSC